MIEISFSTKDNDENTKAITLGDGNSEITIMVNGVTMLTLNRMGFNEITIKECE